MAQENLPPPDWFAIIGALAISVVSGYISIAQRIVRGQKASLLWVTSEFMAAILCGYLAYSVYPSLDPDLPDWLNMPILVALSAHIGGRSFQGFENLLYRKYGVDIHGTRDTEKK